jgi:hypothetical protein
MTMTSQLFLRLSSAGALLLCAIASRGDRSTLWAHDPHPGCSFLDHWDSLAPGAGLDLSACGAPVTADTGSFVAEHGSIVLTPGQSDDLALGDPIAIAGTASDPALDLSGTNYRSASTSSAMRA